MIAHLAINLGFFVLTLVAIYVFLDFTLSLIVKAAVNMGVKGAMKSSPTVVSTFNSLLKAEEMKEAERQARELIETRG